MAWCVSSLVVFACGRAQNACMPGLVLSCSRQVHSDSGRSWQGRYRECRAAQGVAGSETHQGRDLLSAKLKLHHSHNRLTQTSQPSPSSQNSHVTSLSDGSPDLTIHLSLSLLRLCTRLSTPRLTRAIALTSPLLISCTLPILASVIPLPLFTDYAAPAFVHLSLVFFVRPRTRTSFLPHLLLPASSYQLFVLRTCNFRRFQHFTLPTLTSPSLHFLCFPRSAPFDPHQA